MNRIESNRIHLLQTRVIKLIKGKMALLEAKDVGNGMLHIQSSSSNSTLTANCVNNETSQLLNPHSPSSNTLARARRLLYTSHLFAQFSEKSWQFCLILFMAAFANYESLILVSTYGLVSNGSVCIFSGKAGRFVDGSNRLFVARRFILAENLCVILASLACYLLLSRTSTDQLQSSASMISSFSSTNFGSKIHNWFARRLDGIPLDSISLILLLVIHVLGATAMILDSGFIVAVERDWIVVMSQYAGECSVSDDNITNSVKDPISKQWLSQTNVTMKQIDLSCQIAAPAVAGFLIAAFDEATNSASNTVHRDLRGAAILVGIVNVAALVVEYICTARIYRMLPALAFKKDLPGQTKHPNKEQEQLGDQCAPVQRTKDSRWRYLPTSIQIYFDQPACMGGISLSLLYLNVLSFGGIMTAYLVWRGMRLDTVGVWRGVSSAVGLMGTFAYHFSAKRTSLVNTAMWSITYQFVCISLSYFSLFIDGYSLSLTLLIVGVCTSRIGLWVFDISITQLMQESVEESVRGVVGGLQKSLNAFFFLWSFGLGIVFPDPKDFYIYVSAGYVSVGLALILFGTQVYAKRDAFISSL
jgi:solute carrier family 40 (iron-regulated transporter), member 1